MAFAVISDSFIWRLEEYVKKMNHHAGRYNYFGVSGMATNNKFEPAFQQMKRSNPRYVAMNLGGNNIRWNSDIHSVFTDIVSWVERMQSECPDVKQVWVFSIVERGNFPIWTGSTRTSFNLMRRTLNSLLRDHFKDSYVDIGRSFMYPRHYNKDLVHPSHGIGLKLLGDLVKRCFKTLDSSV